MAGGGAKERHVRIADQYLRSGENATSKETACCAESAQVQIRRAGRADIMSETTSPVEVTAPVTCSPGPWVASHGCGVDGESLGFWDIKVQRGSPEYSYMQDLAMVFSSDGHAEANATLMAAALDLLDALQTARRVLEVACGTKAPYIQEAFAAIDAAIAKAVPQ